MSNNTLRSKLLFWRKNTMKKEGLQRMKPRPVTILIVLFFLASNLSQTNFETSAPPLRSSEYPLIPGSQ